MIGRRKGVRIRYVNEPFDWHVDLRAVLVVAAPFFAMLLHSTDQAFEEKQKRLEAERIVVEQVSTLRERIDALDVFMQKKERELKRERERLTNLGGTVVAGNETATSSE